MNNNQALPAHVISLIDAHGHEWRSAPEDIRRGCGDEGVRALLRRLQEHSIDQGVTLSDTLLNTPYLNTLSLEEQPPYPGDLEIERRIGNIICWNAAAILRAQDEGAGLEGYIVTYASAATTLETASHHIFSAAGRGDLVLLQPHSAPGISARAYTSLRLGENTFR